jgi:hypothetical protein
MVATGCYSTGETKYRAVPNSDFLQKHSDIITICGKKYSLESSHSTVVQKIENSPVTLEPREGTKAWRFRYLAPCRVTDSRAAHSIVLEHEKTDRSRGSEVTRPKFEGQQLPPA